MGLRGALAVVLIGAGLGMLTRAGVAITRGALAAAPVIVFGLAGGAVVKASADKRTGLQQISVQSRVSAGPRLPS